MKKIMYAVLGALAIAGTANASDVNNKFYAGLNIGGALPFYTAKYRQGLEAVDLPKNKVSPNIGVVVGKGFGAWGLEANAMLLNNRKNIITGTGTLAGFAVSGTLTEKLTDWMFGLDGYYNFYRHNNWTCRILVGVAGVKSKATLNIATDATGTIILNTLGVPLNRTDNLKTRFAVKAGLATQYAFDDYFGMTASVNYVKVFKHEYLTGAVYANIGVNVYIA